MAEMYLDWEVKGGAEKLFVRFFKASRKTKKNITKNFNIRSFG